MTQGGNVTLACEQHLLITSEKISAMCIQNHAQGNLCLTFLFTQGSCLHHFTHHSMI